MAADMTKKGSPETPAVPTARDPFSAMREEMNDLISRIWGGQSSNLSGLTIAPAVDVSEDDEAYEIHVDAPGVDAENFDIQVHGNTVTLSGKREDKQEEKKKRYHRVERRSGSFSRSITLPADINEDAVVAEYNDGVLSVTLPKSQKSKARKIDVKK
jgi:HSP20 family protein